MIRLSTEADKYYNLYSSYMPSTCLLIVVHTVLHIHRATVKCDTVKKIH